MKNDNKEMLEYIKEDEENKKSSIFKEYEDTISYMLKNNSSIKLIHKYLVDKYNITEKYVALTRYIKRNINLESTDKKNISDSNSDMKRKESQRQRLNKYKA